MLDTFASIGVTAFDVTLVDIHGDKKGFQSNRSVDELRRHLSARLETATRSQHSIVIRPRSTGAEPIQLDDLTAPQIETLTPHVFMTLETSPGNFQAWVAVSDAPKDEADLKQFKTRFRRGAGADAGATGATRLAGSLNFKTKYAPDFPVVNISQARPGHTVTVLDLEQAGLIAREEPPKPPASVPQPNPPARRHADRPRYWPDYGRALAGAPLNRQSNGPDRSKADFMFCKWAAERGWTPEDVSVKLLEVSDRAKEHAARGDANYATLTAENAARIVEKERSARPSVKSTADPR